MRSSSARNFESRYKWLQGISNGSITATSSQLDLLASMRVFCALEVPGSFEKISYNTLKSIGLSLESKALPIQVSLGLWASIKHLREQAYGKALYHKKVLSPLPILSWEDKARRALLDSHIATTAYLDIFYFLQSFLRDHPDCPPEMKLKLENRLSESKAKYQSFLVGFKAGPPKPSLSVIDGGRDLV